MLVISMIIEHELLCSKIFELLKLGESNAEIKAYFISRHTLERKKCKNAIRFELSLRVGNIYRVCSRGFPSKKIATQNNFQLKEKPRT